MNEHSVLGSLSEVVRSELAGRIVDFFTHLLDAGFLPQSACLQQPAVIELHAASNALLALCWCLTPLGIAFVMWRYRHLQVPLSFLFLGAFVIAAGVCRGLEFWTIWHPVYRLETAIEGLTALASIPAAVAFIRVLPRVFSVSTAQQLLAAIVDSSDDAIISKDPSGIITSWNKAAERIFGYTAEEAIGKPVQMLAVPERADEMAGLLERLRSGEPVKHLETERQSKDGRRIPVSLSLSPLRNASGAVIGVSKIARDITDEKESLEALRRQADLLDQSHEAILIRELDGPIVYWNRGAERLYGYSRDEAIGRASPDLLGIGLADATDHIDAALRRDQHWEGELRHVTKGGASITVESRQTVLKESGSRKVVLETNHDITARKNAEEALKKAIAELRDSEQLFRTLAEAVPDMLFIVSRDGDPTYVSARFKQYTGLPGEEAFRNGARRIVHPDDFSHLRNLWRESIATGKPFENEYRLRRYDGVFRWFMGRTAPVYDREGRVHQWLGACTDIDELKRTETALRVSNDQLRQFAYAAAHDLQEPLRNVASSVGLLAKLYGPSLNSDAAQLIGDSIANAQRMHRMVTDLLELTTVLDHTEAPTGLTESQEAVLEALANLDTKIAATGADIQYGTLPPVFVPKVHLVQVFQNLVGNSLKYSRTGVRPEIRISADLKDGEALFTVADNGIGFEPVYAERIFGVFKRLHHHGDYPGTGIGLAICSRIVAHYGGRIWAGGKPGEGASFFFTLPAPRDTAL